MNVAIIGAGLIGNKRALALENEDNLIYVCDKDILKAKELAIQHSAKAISDINAIMESEIDIVIIAVINKYIIEIAQNILSSKKHILCEKPLGINSQESESILLIAKNNNKKIKTGFNHRFHPAMIKAKELINEKAIGELINMRVRYGHGGRIGMEKEWRSSKVLCGGGELIDQGVHIIDLCRWFTNMEVRSVYGKTLISHWKIEVEDNAFFNLEFDDNIIAQCHVSWTNWKNIFSFELFGSDGYISINGLGGNYGRENLEVGYRREMGGRPAIKKYKFENNDNSWSLEWKDFKNAIKNDRNPNGDGYDGYQANKIIEAIYSSSKKNKPININ